MKELPGVTHVPHSDLPYTSRGNTMSLKIENQATPRGFAQVRFSAWSAPITSRRSARASARGVSSTTAIARPRRRLS